ncbi:hypothetical protein [Sinomonas sp. P10A9]|uniref:Uncharacterized protein n=1 Tax=Sinomonas puerhi TaxID=3238584 RepID=A0AB39LAI9_9MICC
MTALPPEARSPREPEGPRRKHLEGANLGGVRALAWSGAVLMAVAAIVWLALGGRSEAMAGHDAGWKGVVAGTAFGLAWVVWFAAGVWFLVLMSVSVMNRLDDSYLTRTPLRRRKK